MGPRHLSFLLLLGSSSLIAGCQLVFDFGDRQVAADDFGEGGTAAVGAGGIAATGAAGGVSGTAGVGGVVVGGSGGAAGGGAGGSTPTCTNLEERCSGNQPEVCSAGSWTSKAPCSLPSPVCSRGSCVAVAAIARGNATKHTCVLLSDDTARCWGRNVEGQLGTGALTTRTLQPSRVALERISALALGYDHSCAVTRDDEVFCWGSADDAVIPGAVGGIATPRRVEGVSDVLQVVVGEHHACALLSSGRASCWGLNSFGQLGRNDLGGSGGPDLVLNLFDVQELTAGTEHTCARNRFGSVYCWGRASSGQLGHGQLTEKVSVPIAAKYADGTTALDGITAVSAGGSHTCARQLSRFLCWGRNDLGQLVYGSFTNPIASAIDASLLGSPHLGVHHTCVLTSAGLVECAGSNSAGQLGNGTLGDGTEQSSAQEVLDLENVDDLGVHARHACALRGDGSVWCWGQNDEGQLGNRQTSVGESRPVQVVW